MASSQPAFTFSLTFQSGQSERTRLVIVMASSCLVTYVSMNMSLTREPLLMKVKPPHSFIGQSHAVTSALWATKSDQTDINSWS